MSGLEDPETRPDEPIVPRAVPLPEPDGDHPEPGWPTTQKVMPPGDPHTTYPWSL